MGGNGTFVTIGLGGGCKLTGFNGFGTVILVFTVGNGMVSCNGGGGGEDWDRRWSRICDGWVFDGGIGRGTRAVWFGGGWVNC